MNFREQGDGPAVLLLHGTPSSSEDFAPVVAELARTHRVFVLDLPGYRGVPSMRGPDAFDRTRRSIEEALRSRRVEEVAIVGYSGGAFRAIDLALRGSLRATHLVSLAGYVTVPEATRQAFRQLATLLRGGLDLRPTLAGQMCAPAALDRSPELARRVEGWLDLISTNDLADELDSFAAYLDATDHTEAFRALEIPVTAVGAELDAAVPPSFSHEMKALNPRVRVEVLPGTGHAMLLEQPEAVVRILRESLRV